MKWPIVASPIVQLGRTRDHPDKVDIGDDRSDSPIFCGGRTTGTKPSVFWCRGTGYNDVVLGGVEYSHYCLYSFRPNSIQISRVQLLGHYLPLANCVWPGMLFQPADHIHDYGCQA